MKRVYEVTVDEKERIRVELKHVGYWQHKHTFTMISKQGSLVKREELMSGGECDGRRLSR